MSYLAAHTIYEITDKGNGKLVALVDTGDGSTCLVQWGGKGEWEEYLDGLAMVLFPDDLGFTATKR